MPLTDRELIDHTSAFVQETLKNAEGGHDWWHIQRVWNNALMISLEEKPSDMMAVQLGALLHDIADSKFHGGDEEIGPRKAREFLESKFADPSLVDHVEAIIRNISFKGGHGTSFDSLEFKIVQDADRLDALGAIGIARTFNYGGFKNRELYNPHIPPNLQMSKEEYKNSNTPTLNHFYEKLLLLKDKMLTKTGKEMAEQRHQFMLEFLEQFYAEWDGLK